MTSPPGFVMAFSGLGGRRLSIWLSRWWCRLPFCVVAPAAWGQALLVLWSFCQDWFLPNVWHGIRIAGKLLFDAYTGFANQVMLPVTGFLMLYFAGYVLKRTVLVEQLRDEGGVLWYWQLLIRWGSPMLLLVMMAATRPGRLSENSARSEDCEKLRVKISASEENGGAI